MKNISISKYHLKWNRQSLRVFLRMWSEEQLHGRGMLRWENGQRVEEISCCMFWILHIRSAGLESLDGAWNLNILQMFQVIFKMFYYGKLQTKLLIHLIFLVGTKDLSISVAEKLWTYAHISIQGSKAVCISLIHLPQSFTC